MRFLSFLWLLFIKYRESPQKAKETQLGGAATQKSIIHRFSQIHTDYKIGFSSICENLCESVDKSILLKSSQLENKGNDWLYKKYLYAFGLRPQLFGSFDLLSWR